MPATPPVRNAIRIAVRSPPSRAAAATRTLPRTHSDMPVNPVSAENTAPTRKKMLRPQRTPSPPVGTGSSSKHEEDDDHEHTEGLELAAQVRGRAFLYGTCDVLHPLGALAGREHLPHQHAGHAEREQRRRPRR